VDIEYPDSDGQPMADNTLQFEWIVTIKGNLDGYYREDSNVFIAGDLLWYPVEGDNKIRTAPDVFAVFGRPKGYRGSYRQWEEGNIPPQVVFEILSPGNRPGVMQEKFDFYDLYGVEEYYIYDPHYERLTGWLRQGEHLQPIPQMHNWISPRLGIRFDMSENELKVFQPSGERFATFVELCAQNAVIQARAELEHHQREAAQAQMEMERHAKEAAQAQMEMERLEKEAARIQAQQQRLQREAVQAQAEQDRRDKETAQAHAEQERRDREAAQAKAEQLAARLRTMAIDPEAVP
jgi:Uma2 family endonuclease